MRIICVIKADNGRAITNKVINKPLIAFNKSDLLMFAIFSCGRSLQREVTLNLYKLSPKLQKADHIGNIKSMSDYEHDDITFRSTILMKDL